MESLQVKPKLVESVHQPDDQNVSCSLECERQLCEPTDARQENFAPCMPQVVQSTCPTVHMPKQNRGIH
jgi:hypothetical protein